MKTVTANFHCGYCDKLHSSIDEQEYEYDDKTKTSIKLICRSTKREIADVVIVEMKEVKRGPGRPKKNFSVGMGEVGEPQR